MMGNCLGTDEVSQIYPMDTMNELYYNYSPKNSASKNLPRHQNASPND